MSSKKQLISLAKQINKAEIEFLEGLSVDEKSQIGKVDDWSIKDMFVHISVWKGIMAERLAGGDSFQGLQVDPDFEKTNIAIYNKYASTSWLEIDHLVKGCHKALIAGIDGLADGDLQSTDMYSWQDGQALWQRIYGTDIIHPALHLSECYIKRGDVEKAKDLIVAVSERAMELSEDDEWRGAQHYNIACYDALSGNREAALEKLKTAFPLRQDLLPWAQEDTDLKSLWGDEEFLALIKEYSE